jgi:cellobiose phosphorylase
MTMLNPVNHTRTPKGMQTYRLEPYVVAADVYALPPHTGRGGWSWYTGSAGWMYRLIVESLLGVTLERECLRFTPCLPADWTSFTMRYRHHETPYAITVRQTRAGAAEAIDAIDVTVDGVLQTDGSVHLVDDRAAHRVLVEVRVAAKQPCRTFPTLKSVPG